MNNIDEFRSADFGKYLLESKMVAAGKEKFMVHWTRKFLVPYSRKSVTQFSTPLRGIKNKKSEGFFKIRMLK
jgi:hypothetical protein